VSKLKHYHGFDHLPYSTTSAYRRVRFFDSEAAGRLATVELEVLFSECRFSIADGGSAVKG
jgi:hypothetical protein